MKRPGLTIVGALFTVVLLANGVVTPAWAAAGVQPLPGPVVRGFDPPEDDWLPGHRGVDLQGEEGDTVVAAADGTVSFAGTVAGRGVVTLDHGELRTTYEPVTPLVHAGDQVTAGQAIALLNAGHAGCPIDACLHWGLKRRDEYLDPLSLLGREHVRLLPASAVETAQRAAQARAAALATGGGAPGLLIRPAAGPITSPFGDRMHPILHVMRLHNGVDIGAGCETPILAAATGVVESVSSGEETGTMLVLDHGVIGGHHLRTIYMHASGYVAQVGDHVAGGELIGHVGTTGLSTGCHLHFSVTLDGNYVNPEDYW